MTGFFAASNPTWLLIGFFALFGSMTIPAAWCAIFARTPARRRDALAVLKVLLRIKEAAEDDPKEAAEDDDSGQGNTVQS